MKKRNIFFAAAISVLAFASCNNDEDGGGSGEQAGIKFTTSIDALDTATPQLRAAGSSWDKNDEIGIYMVKNGMGLSSGTAYAENKHYITESEGASGVFAAADLSSIINFPEEASTVDYIAYYPYKTTITDYKYPIDVTAQSSQPAIDFLYSNNAVGLDKTTTNVPLKFKHKLSKLIFNISSENVSDLSGLSIALKGTKTKATYNLAGGSNAFAADDNSVADIQAKTSNTGTTGEAIILPTTGAEGRTLAFTMSSGKAYAWNIPADFIFEEGKKYTYNVKLQKSGTLNIEINDAQIEDWTDTPSEVIVPDEVEDSPVEGNVELDKLYGFAEGTTGGEGGTVYHFDDGKKFRDWLKLREKNTSSEPAIVWLSGTFTKNDGRDDSHPWFDIKRTSNISIYGTQNFKMQNLGFFISYGENIIIRNIHVVQPKADNGADGVSIQNSSKIWIDHCTFESENQVKDYEDGSVDVTHGSNKVTVSWNRFIKTQKTCLVGHSDSQTSDTQISATFHHNFFDESSSRHPRVRYGTVHVYNNFYNQVSTYGAGSAYGAMVLVENNSFDGVRLPTDICTYPAKSSGSNLNGSVAGFLFAADNEYTNIPANQSDPYPFTNVEYKAYGGEKLSQPLTRADFTPSYSYIVDAAENVSAIVRSGAGAGKLSNYATAPINVDNAGMPDSEDSGSDGDGDTEETGTALGGGWSAIDIGTAAGVNTVESDKSSITMTGKGKFEGGAQAFNYVYKEISGDFEITAQLDSYVTSGTTNQSEAGLLFTTDLTAGANDFLFALCAKGGNSSYNYSHRLATGSNSARGTIGAAVEGAVILKLKRTGNMYYASYSIDGGTTYSTTRSGTFTEGLPDKLYVGLAVNSASTSETATAKFSNVQINGSSASFAD